MYKSDIMTVSRVSEMIKQTDMDLYEIPSFKTPDDIIGFSTQLAVTFTEQGSLDRFMDIILKENSIDDWTQMDFNVVIKAISDFFLSFSEKVLLQMTMNLIEKKKRSDLVLQKMTEQMNTYQKQIESSMDSLLEEMQSEINI